MTVHRAAYLGVPVLLAALGYAFSCPSSPVSLDLAAQAANSTSLQLPGEPTDRVPEIYHGSFLYTSVPEMLAALGVTTLPQDKVYAFPDPALHLGSEIRIYRATPVTVTDAGSSTIYQTWAGTVGDLLSEEQYELGDQDIVQPANATAIIPGKTLQVTITRVAQAEVKTQESIPYSIVKKDDPTLNAGTQQVDQPGANGTWQLTWLVRRENGVVVSRTLLKKEILEAPIDKIIRIGTKLIVYGTGLASWYSGVPAMTAAHRTLPMGTMVRVTNLANGKSVDVKINDRGPFVAGRIIDLSSDAFASIANLGSGVASVQVSQIPPPTAQ